MKQAFLNIAAWLLPDDQRGEATLGDLEEIHQRWVGQHGARIAAAKLAAEIARSLLPFAWSGIVDRRASLLIGRSLPALVGGYIAYMAPLGFGQGARGDEAPAALLWLIMLMNSFAAFGAGYVVAALAGAAHRQHATALGVLIAVSGISFGASALPTSSQWFTLLVALLAIPAAAFGGVRCRARAVRRARIVAETIHRTN